MRRPLAITALALTGYGCQCNDEPAAPPAPPPAQPSMKPDSRFPHARIFNSCGAEGLELLLVLGASGTGCQPVGAERLTVLLRRDRYDAPTTLRLGGRQSDGTARLCPSGGQPCVPARRGRLTLQRFEPDQAAAGKWQVELEDGRVLDGTFTASFCANEAGICQ